MSGKRVDKAGGKAPTARPIGKPFTGRDDPRRNNTIPGTGRPPDAWRALCRELSSRTAMIQTAEKVLKDQSHPAWLGAWKFLAEQGYGKAAQTFQGPDGGPIPVQVINAPGFAAIVPLRGDPGPSAPDGASRES